MPETSSFVDPPWRSPLDVEAVLKAIPQTSTIAGMFFLALLEGAKRRGVTLSAIRPRYLGFNFYPVVEFAPLIVEAAKKFYPERPLREGLRLIGQVGPAAFAGSVIGKVTLGSTEGAQAAITAIASTYRVNLPGSRCDVLETSPRSMILGLRNVYHFLDSHHVGVFEGVLEYAHVAGQIRIASHSPISADLLIEW